MGKLWPGRAAEKSGPAGQLHREEGHEGESARVGQEEEAEAAETDSK